TVGTSTSAVRAASAICCCVIGVSSRFNLASNSSRIRVSIESGSLRVTTTRGFFLTDMCCSHEAMARPAFTKSLLNKSSLSKSGCSDLINPVVRHCGCCAVRAVTWSFPYVPLVPRTLPRVAKGNFRERPGVLVLKRSVLSIRRPGQDKNPQESPRDPLGNDKPGCDQSGHRGLEFSLGFQALAVGFNSKNSS